MDIKYLSESVIDVAQTCLSDLCIRFVCHQLVCQICVPMGWKIKALDDQKVPDSAKVKQAVGIILF